MRRSPIGIVMCLIMGLGYGGPATADSPEEVTICVNNVVPRPLPPCFTIEGDWSASGGIVGGGTTMDNCGSFNGMGVSVDIDVTLFDDSGASLSLINHTILDWQNLGACEVPDPNPCGLTCDNLYNARQGQWQLTGGTGPWANIQGEGTALSLINREYDGEGLCPLLTDEECSSNLCDRSQGKCFRRVAHGHLSGRAHVLKTP